ncbi:protocadherin wing polarity protein stan-like, partial [Tropilaelaps mercedesae]
FHGDGHLTFKSSLRPIDIPWSVRLSLRTKHRQGLLLLVELGGNERRFVLQVANGTVVAAIDEARVAVPHLSVADGEWHQLHFWWNANILGLSVDGDHYRSERHTHQSPAGHYIGDVWIGGHESEEYHPFRGCVENVQIGNQRDAYREPSSERNVFRGCAIHDLCASNPCPDSSTCANTFEGFRCNCKPGFVGSQCLPICSLNPCEHNTTSSCVTAPSTERGYQCLCGAKHYGERCEMTMIEHCPANWWGTPPFCGPCQCDVHKGYSSNCDKTSGDCVCEENHYFAPDQGTCLPCNCYAAGSHGSQCDASGGQCRCREGVIGKNCDGCSNEFAEVTLRGCEVIYDGCPRARHSRVWWPRTSLGSEALSVCPTLAQGKCSRYCDPNDGWQMPDLFHCLSDPLAPLAEELALIEKSNIQLRAHNSRRLARELHEALRRALDNNMDELYGSDVRTVSQTLSLILEFEAQQAGFNLSHTQDRHFVRYLMQSLATVADARLAPLWQRLSVTMRLERLLARVEAYARRLLANMEDTFTAPFLLNFNENTVFGVDHASYGELHVDNTTSSYVYSITTGHRSLPLIRMPKFNNIPIQKLPKWIPKVGVPLSALSLDTYGNDSKALFAIAAFRDANALYPLMYDSTINHALGVSVSSAVVSVSVAKSDSKFSLLEQLGGEGRVHVSFPILHGRFPRNPQCVFWYISPATGYGKWSARGCRVEGTDALRVNCSCDHLSMFAVLTEDSYTLARTQISYSQELSASVALIFSIALLTTTAALLIALTIASGGYSTNSHAIHVNVIICLLLVDLISLVGIRSHAPASASGCRLVAIAVHFAWLAVFSWMLVDLLHIYRMLTEMKDVNHGSMKFYFSLAYGAPALIVALTLGIRSDLYAGYNFCWLSAASSLVWSQAGPVATLVAGALLLAAASVMASVRVQGVELISDLGNIRFLLWLAMAQLPIITFFWLSSMFAAAGSAYGWLVFSICTPLAAISVFLCQCILNARVRQNLWEMLRGRRKCLLAYYGGGAGSGLSASRSALSYGGRVGVADMSLQGTLQRRHVIMGAYSTTSRSTTHRSSSFASSATGQRTHPGEGGRRKKGSKGSRRKSRDDRDSMSENSGSRGSRGSEFNKYGSHEDLQSVDQESMDLASSHSSDKDTITYTEEHAGGGARQDYTDSEADDQNEMFDEDTARLHREHGPSDMPHQGHLPQQNVSYASQQMLNPPTQHSPMYGVGVHEAPITAGGGYSPEEVVPEGQHSHHRPYSGASGGPRGGSVMGHHDDPSSYASGMSLSRTATLPLATRMLLSDNSALQQSQPTSTSPEQRGTRGEGAGSDGLTSPGQDVEFIDDFAGSPNNNTTPTGGDETSV